LRGWYFIYVKAMYLNFIAALFYFIRNKLQLFFIYSLLGILFSLLAVIHKIQCEIWQPGNGDK